MSYQAITSLQHPLVKYLRKLVEKKSFRFEKRRLVISGKTLIKELSTILPIKTLLAEQELSLSAESCFQVPKEILQKITGLKELDGALAEVEMPVSRDLLGCEKILILDGVQDPGNVGTILRSAKAFGFDGAHFASGCCDPFNDKALRASKGAIFQLKLSYNRDLKFEGKRYLADPRGAPLDQVSVSKPFALVLGNEARGIRSDWEGEKIAIPIEGVESLNVAMAATLLCYEMR